MKRYTKEHISQLLAKYMDGTTTLEEEEVLSLYFRQDDVQTEWHDYQLLFQEIEAMKPQPTMRHSRRRYLRWSVAAAVVSGGLFVSTTLQQTGQTAQTTIQAEHTTRTMPTRQAAPIAVKTERQGAESHPKPTNHTVVPDNDSLNHIQEKQYTSERKSCDTHKPDLDTTDYDNTAVLLAEAEEELRQVEQQIVRSRLEVIHARLLSAGYVAVQEEDGTVTYKNESSKYCIYEE